MQEISLLAEDLLASQTRLCSMQYITTVNINMCTYWVLSGDVPKIVVPCKNFRHIVLNMMEN
jgi:hypothetical protein